MQNTECQHVGYILILLLNKYLFHLNGLKGKKTHTLEHELVIMNMIRENLQ